MSDLNRLIEDREKRRQETYFDEPTMGERVERLVLGVGVFILANIGIVAMAKMIYTGFFEGAPF